MTEPRKIKVLIVGQATEWQQEMRKWLALQPGVQVIGVVNTEQQLASARLPDIILLDFDMLGTTSIELLRRNITSNIVLLISNSSADTLRRALRTGASDYLTVPVDYDELVRTIHYLYLRSSGTADS